MDPFEFQVIRHSALPVLALGLGIGNGNVSDLLAHLALLLVRNLGGVLDVDRVRVLVEAGLRVRVVGVVGVELDGVVETGGHGHLEARSLLGGRLLLRFH